MAQRIEALGYSALWIPEALGRHAFVNSANLLAATDELVIATGIAGIHNHQPWSAKMAATELDELSGGRFVLGLGVSHAPMVTLRGVDYSKPLTAMRQYLDVIDEAVTMTPGEMAPIVLAALGPKMLELSASRTAGAHPYWTTPEHTAQAREIVGPDAWLCVEQKCVLTTDREIAHARANANDLVREIGLPGTLAALGIEDNALPAVAAKANTDHLSATNPRAADEGDYLRLLRQALG